jgi:hypothetical protein
MGLSLDVRDHDEGTGLSRLEVTAGTRTAETPLRMVNRNDLNAKSRVGAELQVTGDGRLFVSEHAFDHTGLNGILRTNGFLGQSASNVGNVLSHVDRGSIRVIYPKLTQKALTGATAAPSAKGKVADFFVDLAVEAPADAYAIQYSLLGPTQWARCEKADISIIPVVDVHDLAEVEKALVELPKRGPGRVPMIGFTYAIYRRANLAFERILEAREALHAAGIGVAVFGAPRTIGGDGQSKDLSAPHYSSFRIADTVGQRYYDHGGAAVRVCHVFEKSELAAPQIAEGHRKEEHAGEDAAFAGDPKLQALFWRTIEARNTDEDWVRSRVSAITRLHELSVSRGEYEYMRGRLSAGDLGEYLDSKARLSTFLEAERPES